MVGEMTPLRRRIVRALPFTLDLGDFGKFEFQLSYDFNSASALQENTVSKQNPAGIKLPDLEAWSHISEPVFVTALFWAGIINRHPEYNSEEGLKTIRSYVDEGNSDLIVQACWNAYLLNLPKAKRDFMEDLKKKAEAGIKAANPPSPATPPETAPEETSIGSTSGPSPDTTSDSAKASSAS